VVGQGLRGLGFAEDRPPKRAIKRFLQGRHKHSPGFPILPGSCLQGNLDRVS
jgi:hypothetical protein